MDDIERRVKRIEEGEAWDETDEVVEVEVKRPLDKVIPVRLSSEKWEELRREARELGIGPTTLARMWILEKLRQVIVPEAIEPGVSAWTRCLDMYSFPVDLADFRMADQFVGYFRHRLVPGTRAQTRAFEDYFRQSAPNHIEPWYEVVFWKLYGRANLRDVTTERIIEYLGRRDPRELWEACMAYIEAPARDTFKRFHALFGLRGPAIAVVATFPAFVDPERFPMIDRRTSNWVYDHYDTFSTRNVRCRQHLVRPRRRFGNGGPNVLTLPDFDGFVVGWINWCRCMAAELTRLTSNKWRARDVEMAVFQATDRKQPVILSPLSERGSLALAHAM